MASKPRCNIITSNCNGTILILMNFHVATISMPERHFYCEDLRQSGIQVAGHEQQYILLWKINKMFIIHVHLHMYTYMHKHRHWDTKTHAHTSLVYGGLMMGFHIVWSCRLLSKFMVGGWSQWPFAASIQRHYVWLWPNPSKWHG